MGSPSSALLGRPSPEQVTAALPASYSECRYSLPAPRTSAPFRGSGKPEMFVFLPLSFFSRARFPEARR